MRLVLILGWVAAMTGVMAIVVSIEAATGHTGIVMVIGLFVVFPIAGKALQMIGRL